MRELRRRLALQRLLIAVQLCDRTHAEHNKLVRAMRRAGGHYQFVKKTLMRLAIANTPFEPLSPLLHGRTCVAMSACPVAAAHVVVEHCDKYPTTIYLGGTLFGRAINRDVIEKLAQLPLDAVTRDRVLVTNVTTALLGVIFQLINVLQAVPAMTLGVLSLRPETLPSKA